MEQSSSWEADIRAGAPIFFHLLWIPNAHYRLHKSQKYDAVLCQMSAGHDVTSYFLKIRPIVNILSVPRFAKMSFPFRLLII
jgi:hypothetical protein